MGSVVDERQDLTRGGESRVSMTYILHNTERRTLIIDSLNTSALKDIIISPLPILLYSAKALHASAFISTAHSHAIRLFKHNI